eukprot:403370389
MVKLKKSPIYEQGRLIQDGENIYFKINRENDKLRENINNNFENFFNQKLKDMNKQNAQAFSGSSSLKNKNKIKTKQKRTVIRSIEAKKMNSIASVSEFQTPQKLTRFSTDPSNMIMSNILLKNKIKLELDNSQYSTNYGYTKIINRLFRKSELTGLNQNELPMLQIHKSTPLTQNYSFKNTNLQVMIEKVSNNILPEITNQEAQQIIYGTSYSPDKYNHIRRNSSRRITELIKINKLYQINDDQKLPIKAKSDGQIISQQTCQKILEEERQLRDIVFLAS